MMLVRDLVTRCDGCGVSFAPDDTPEPGELWLCPDCETV